MADELTDLSKLSPAVRDAAARMDAYKAALGLFPFHDWDVIRAELSRMSAVEAELKGIKERIAGAPVGSMMLAENGNVRKWHAKEIVGFQRVRLLLDDPATREAAE